MITGYQDDKKANPPAILLDGWAKCSHTCACGAKVWWGVSMKTTTISEGVNVKCWKCDKVSLVGPRP